MIQDKSMFHKPFLTTAQPVRAFTSCALSKILDSCCMVQIWPTKRLFRMHVHPESQLVNSMRHWCCGPNTLNVSVIAKATSIENESIDNEVSDSCVFHKEYRSQLIIGEVYEKIHQNCNCVRYEVSCHMICWRSNCRCIHGRIRFTEERNQYTNEKYVWRNVDWRSRPRSFRNSFGAQRGEVSEVHSIYGRSV